MAGFSFSSGSGLKFTGLGPSRSRSAMTITPSPLPAPDAPDMSELLAAYGGLPQMFNPRRLLRTIDSAISASRTETGQTGRNAARAYTNQLQNYGINSAGAAGVVEAQARRAGNENTRELMSERESLALQAKKEQASLQANIGSSLAGIRNDYIKTIADYNSKKATLQYNADAANAGNALSYDQLEQQREIEEARLALAASEGAGGTADPSAINPGPIMTPGYIPNSGPLIPATINGIPQYRQVFTPGSIIAMGGQFR